MNHRKTQYGYIIEIFKEHHSLGLSTVDTLVLIERSKYTEIIEELV